VRGGIDEIRSAIPEITGGGRPDVVPAVDRRSRIDHRIRRRAIDRVVVDQPREIRRVRQDTTVRTVDVVQNIVVNLRAGTGPDSALCNTARKSNVVNDVAADDLVRVRVRVPRLVDLDRPTRIAERRAGAQAVVKLVELDDVIVRVPLEFNAFIRSISEFSTTKFRGPEAEPARTARPSCPTS
jgi:hypothetical protein